jgi:membrane-bound ClpP family serine protease
MFHRYYPHRHYYGIHGYRGSYYGTGIGGFFASIGMVMMIIGIILAIEPTGFNLGHPLIWAGVGVMFLGGLISAIFASRMNRMRARFQHEEFAEEAQAQSHGTTTTSTTTTTHAPQGGRCGACGGQNSGGNHCQYCGARL